MSTGTPNEELLNAATTAANSPNAQAPKEFTPAELREMRQKNVEMMKDQIKFFKVRVELQELETKMAVLQAQEMHAYKEMAHMKNEEDQMEAEHAAARANHLQRQAAGTEQVLKEDAPPQMQAQGLEPQPADTAVV